MRMFCVKVFGCGLLNYVGPSLSLIIIMNKVVFLEIFLVKSECVKD